MMKKTILFLCPFILIVFLLTSLDIKLFPAFAQTESGEIYLQPSQKTINLTENLEVEIMVNVGSGNKLNLANVTLNFDQAKLEIIQNGCLPGSGFQGIIGQTPCSFNNSLGTLNFSLMTTNVEGPSGTNSIGKMTFLSKAEGVAQVIFTETEIIVKDSSSGESKTLPIAPPTDGNYQIGQAPGTCPLKDQGDANCDGKVSIIDFEVWRREAMNGSGTLKADFNNDGAVNAVDYEIWRIGSQPS